MLNSTKYSPVSVRVPAEMPPVQESAQMPCARWRSAGSALRSTTRLSSSVTSRVTRAPTVRCPLLAGAGIAGLTMLSSAATIATGPSTPWLNGRSQASIGFIPVATLPTSAP